MWFKATCLPHRDHSFSSLPLRPFALRSRFRPDNHVPTGPRPPPQALQPSELNICKEVDCGWFVFMEKSKGTKVVVTIPVDSEQTV